MCYNRFGVRLHRTYRPLFRPDAYYRYRRLSIENVGKNIWSFEPDLNWNFVLRVDIRRTSDIGHCLFAGEAQLY